MNKGKKQETLDICVIARYKDKEIAVKDLLKALFDENEKLVEKNKTFENYNKDLNNQLNKLEEENERLKAEVDLLNDDRHYLNNKIGKAIIFIRKNIQLNNGALSNREELIVSKHDLIKNETDVLNCLIKILKGSEE